MNTLAEPHLAATRILLVGTGGVGAPCAIALAEAGVGALRIADDDVVELTNLHRQLLFSEADVGTSKPEAARRSLLRRRPDLDVQVFEGRATPDTVFELLRNVDVVVDATDNFATRFLLADACHLSAVPVVHAAAVRWVGTVMSVRQQGAPCYRCLFEDLPGEAPDCATAGIVGPVCGVIGGIAAEMALALAQGSTRFSAKIATFDGQRDQLRLVEVAARASCALCGPHATIRDLVETRYIPDSACPATMKEIQP
jgi:molybdopterin/thiamine biosynthesis adenylyltransferase